MKRIVSSSIALSLVFVMLLTSGIIVNASEVQPVNKTTDENGNVVVNTTTETTNYNSITDTFFSDVKAEPILKKETAEDIDTIDVTKHNSDNDYKSCRLIVTSTDDLEFKEDSYFSNDIVNVQRFQNRYFVTYKNPEVTQKAFEDMTSFGLDVEIDMEQDTPEDVENKDNNNKDVKTNEIASTNKNKETKDLEETNKKSENENKKSIVVAVLDTGLNDGEEIFTDKVIEGKNFIDENEDYNDIDGHGTTMSRLILDTVGTDNNIKIMPVKVLNDEGKGTTLSAYKGIEYIIEQKEKNPNLDFVISLSMTGVGQSKILTSAINDAHNNGIPVVVSAGNENKDIKDYTPANIRSAFTISSAYQDEDTNTYKKEVYSNYGDGIDYATNGIYEYTRIINEREVYTRTHGTSVASAYVTSYIAILKMVALSDEDENNDKLSVTDVDNSLKLSAIELENTDYFGNGYLAKENLVLTNEKHYDRALPVSKIDFNDMSEGIELTESRAYIQWREVWVYGFHPDTNWSFDLYEMTDRNWINGYPPYTEIDSRSAGKNGYTILQPMQGGNVEAWGYSDRVKIVWSDVTIEGTTTWFRAWLNLPDNYEYTYTEYIYDPGNSTQEYATPDRYQNDYMGQWVDVYMGIGFYDYDVGFHWKKKHEDFKVTYFTDGGSWGAEGDTFTLDYDYNGYNPMFGLVGTDANASPTKEGYIFKGWYFTDWNWNIDTSTWCTVPKNSITDLIDYAHRYPDVVNFPGNNYLGIPLLAKMNEHFWACGYNEGRRYADHPATVLDSINGYNFDDYRQLLKPGEHVGGFYQGDNPFELKCDGKWFIAHAVYEKVPGFEVTWDTNGGEWTDGSTNDVTFTYNCNGKNELLPNYYVGIDANASPTKDGKILKGWYFTYDDGSQRKVPQVTDMIDYYNRNPQDLQREGICTAFGMLSMNSLWRHWCDFGQGEHRQIAERAKTLNDIDNKESDYDYGDQLLKPGQYFCNTFVEGSYDLKNYKLRAYAIYMDGHKIDYVLNGGTNHPNNPKTYEVNQPISIFPATKENNNFVGWSCDKPVKIKGVTYEAYTNLGTNFVLDTGDYGDLTFIANFNPIPIPKYGTGECGDQGLPHPSPSGHNYSVIWDSNTHQYGYGNRSGDFQTGTYMHTWWDPCHHTVKCNCGKYGCSTCCEGGYWYGDMVTFPSPKTPKTPTLHFNDPNAHGNTPDIVSPIKTVKDFVGWNGSIPAGYTARDLTGEGSVIRYNAKWQRRTYQLPSASKAGYDFLGWQIQGDNDVNGRIYRAGETFVIPDKVTRYGTFIFDPCMENDYTFVAVWRRNEGQIRYNANGAVDNNNREYAQVTDNTKTKLTSNYTTKSGNIFGTEYKEDTFVKNETTKNKVGTTITNKYILNKGDITNTLGTKDKLSTFQGWSSVNYARHDTQNILYNGQTIFRNMYYDSTAAVLLNLTNKPYPYTIQNVINNANKIEAHRKNNIDKYGNTPRNGFIGDWFAPLTSDKAVYDRSLEGHGIVDMYATWDEFPAFIEVDDVTILSSDLEKKNIFETDAQIQQRIETRIMRDMIVTDKEQENHGRLPYGELPHNVGKDKGKIGIEVVDLDLDAMREIGTGMTGGILVTIQATDSAGHITKTQIMLYVNQVTSEEDLTGEMKDNYTRFITKDSYTATYENGGPYSKSKWRLVDAYRNELLTSFDNLDKLVSIDNSSQPIPQNTEVWYFTHDDVEKTREFVLNNGIGKSKRATGLAEYQNTIKNNKTNKVKTIVNEEPK